jgi:hypothetical protein
MTQPTIQKILEDHGVLPKELIIISIKYIYNRQVEIES